MASAIHSEGARIEDMISRLQGVIGHVAVLHSQVREVDMELTEIESLADDLIQFLAHAQAEFDRIE
jgi:hypothetical protein